MGKKASWGFKMRYDEWRAQLEGPLVDEVKIVEYGKRFE